MWRLKGGVGETFLRNLFGNFSYLFYFFVASLEKGSAFRHKLLVVLEASHTDVLRVSSAFLAHTRDKRERHARRFKVRPESAWGAI